DIGRFVMFQHAPPNLLAVDESHWETPAELIEADVAIYKITHSELGFKACKHWRLPDSICNVIRRHHTPIEKEIIPGSIDALIYCVQVADNLCLSLLQKDDFDEIPFEEREQKILDRCITTQQQAKLLPVNALLANLDGIRAESIELLAGLGFA
ncbi:MAG: HDOD domain-containing protein, partial [Woeseiaceae bacterium]